MLVAVAGLMTRERRLLAAVGAVQRNRRWLAATLSSIGDGVATTDLDGRLTYLNPVAEAMLGWRRGEAVGREIGEVVRISRDGEGVERPVASVLEGGGRIVADSPRTLVDRG